MVQSDNAAEPYADHPGRELERPGPAQRLGVNVKAILTPQFIFYMENHQGYMQGGVRMTLTPLASSAAAASAAVPTVGSGSRGGSGGPAASSASNLAAAARQRAWPRAARPLSRAPVCSTCGIIHTKQYRAA